MYEIPNLQKFSEIPVHFHVIPSDSVTDSIGFCLFLARLIPATGGGREDSEVYGHCFH